ncbi:MAG: alanine dehydrogenase [Gammaproteobacteria bacterium]|jgi:alanine dehydrogenase
MRIGIPREIKTLEGRVALIPDACADLVEAGHEVLLERDAGTRAGYPDDQYRRAGVKVVDDAATLYGEAQLLLKVKEPVEGDLALLRKDHTLFCYLHLAANAELTRQLREIGLTAVAFETVEESDGRLPLLAPMSDIAGRLSVQVGTHLLHQPEGGRGILLGGMPAAERGHVVIIGAGVAGGNAAAVAAALGAQVTVFDRKREKLAAMQALGPNVTALYPYAHAIDKAVRQADMVVGAVLVVGQRAPHVVSADLVRSMAAGSVVVDISVDQGGCIETTRPTTYDAPTYVWEDVVHFTVTNMPGAVPRTAVQALSAALLPYVVQMAEGESWTRHEALRRGLNIQDGRIVHPGVAASLG